MLFTRTLFTEFAKASQGRPPLTARCAAARCLQPSHQADDIGAMFGVPSSFSVEINATGVRKYRMVGSMVLCMGGVCTGDRCRSIRFGRANWGAGVPVPTEGGVPCGPMCGLPPGHRFRGNSLIQ